jgi:hypothetical protein
MNIDLIEQTIKSSLSFYSTVLSPEFASDGQDPNHSIKINLVREALALKAEAESENIAWETAVLMMDVYKAKIAYSRSDEDDFLFSLLMFKIGNELGISVVLSFAPNIMAIAKLYQDLRNWHRRSLYYSISVLQ